MSGVRNDKKCLVRKVSNEKEYKAIMVIGCGVNGFILYYSFTNNSNNDSLVICKHRTGVVSDVASL